MKLLDIFKKSNSDFGKEKIISSMTDIETVQDLVHTLSHYEIHTLAVALFNAVQIIELMDPENAFQISDQAYKKQKKSEIINLTQLFADEAKDSYERNKQEVDAKFINHVN